MKRNDKFILMALFVFLSSILFVSADNLNPFGGMGLNSSTYTFTSQLASQGVIQELIAGDSIKFPRKVGTLFETYTLTINQISDNSVILIIQNKSDNIILNLGENKKITLSSTGFYDLSLKLESISNGKAEINLQTIHELIPLPPEIKQSNETAAPVDSKKSKINFSWKNLGIGAGVLILILFIIFILNLRKKIRSAPPVHYSSYRIVK